MQAACVASSFKAKPRLHESRNAVRRHRVIRGRLVTRLLSEHACHQPFQNDSVIFKLDTVCLTRRAQKSHWHGWYARRNGDQQGTLCRATLSGARLHRRVGRFWNEAGGLLRQVDRNGRTRSFSLSARSLAGGASAGISATTSVQCHPVHSNRLARSEKRDADLRNLTYSDIIEQS